MYHLSNFTSFFFCHTFRLPSGLVKALDSKVIILMHSSHSPPPEWTTTMATTTLTLDGQVLATPPPLENAPRLWMWRYAMLCCAFFFLRNYNFSQHSHMPQRSFSLLFIIHFKGGVSCLSLSVYHACQVRTIDVAPLSRKMRLKANLWTSQSSTRCLHELLLTSRCTSYNIE